ncbi:hypothetical protein BDN67DRAFT_1015387 [Paxillus ammoniavirescens]|nr:hypothetical protein BDN67DRAFT_1015387 [Paxillus ammoniavirescens]
MQGQPYLDEGGMQIPDIEAQEDAHPQFNRACHPSCEAQPVGHEYGAEDAAHHQHNNAPHPPRPVGQDVVAVHRRRNCPPRLPDDAQLSAVHDQQSLTSSSSPRIHQPLQRPGTANQPHTTMLLALRSCLKNGPIETLITYLQLNGLNGRQLVKKNLTY